MSFPKNILTNIDHETIMKIHFHIFLFNYFYQKYFYSKKPKKKNKKKNGGILLTQKKKIITTTILLITILLAFLGGQTFSKYITEVKGEGTANIARWNFLVNGNDQQIQKINLASTINNLTLLNNKIAPGTKGSFEIAIDTTGTEVGMNYQILFLNEQNKPQNLKFRYNNLIYNDLSEMTNDLSGTITANDENKRIVKTIEWEWPYETGNTEEEIKENDKIDTENAKLISSYNFEILVSGTQLMPTN